MYIVLLICSLQFLRCFNYHRITMRNEHERRHDLHTPYANTAVLSLFEIRFYFILRYLEADELVNNDHKQRSMGE